MTFNDLAYLLPRYDWLIYIWFSLVQKSGFPIFVQSERGISLSLHWHQLFSFLPILRVINLCPRRITLETFILSPTQISWQMSKFFVLFALFRFFDQKLFFPIQIYFKLHSAIYWLTSDFFYFLGKILKWAKIFQKSYFLGNESISCYFYSAALGKTKHDCEAEQKMLNVIGDDVIMTS